MAPGACAETRKPPLLNEKRGPQQKEDALVASGDEGLTHVKVRQILMFAQVSGVPEIKKTPETPSIS